MTLCARFSKINSYFLFTWIFPWNFAGKKDYVDIFRERESVRDGIR